MEDSSGNERNSGGLDELTAILPNVVAAFQKLSAEHRLKLFNTIATLFDLVPPSQGYSTTSRPSSVPTSQPSQSRFSEDRTISAKAFLLEKQPRTDVERVACLAYYLTHYLDTPHFSTLDISKLNTDAAQAKFSNAANSVGNATKMGYLVPASKGNKQLSAAGEQFVQSLPDREAAKTAMALTKPRRRTKRSDKQIDEVTDDNGQ